MIRSFIVFLLVSTTVTYLVAQDIRDDIMATFDSDAVWITKYNGVIDNTNRIDLYFADDGTHFIVRSHYPSTGAITTYERRAKGDTIILTEYQELRKVSALHLWSQGEGYRGYWQHANGNTKPVVFYKSNKDIDCGQMKYHHILRGDKHHYEVKRSYKNPTLSIDGDMISISCQNSTCDEFSFIYDERDYSLRHIDSRDWKLLSNYGNQELEFAYGYDFVCEEKTSYEQMWSLEYPDLKNVSFQEFLRENIEAIMIEAKEESDSDAVADRFNVMIKNWVDITFFDKEMISGYLYAQASITDKVNKYAFIYDLKNGEAIKLDRPIFTTMDDANKNLVYVVLSQEGLELTSDFSPIYGEQKMILTFAEAKNKIDNKRLRKICKKYE